MVGHGPLPVLAQDDAHQRIVQEAVVLVSDPRQPSPDVGTSFPLAGSAAGRALAERTPCVLDPLKPREPRFREEPLLAAYGYGSLVSFPLVFENELLGTLDIAHPPREGLRSEERRVGKECR